MNINIIMCGKNITFIELVNAFTLSMYELGYNINNIYTYIPEKNINPTIDNKGVNVNVYIGAMVINTRHILDSGVFNILFNTEQQGHFEMIGCKTSIDVWKDKASRFDMVIDMFRSNDFGCDSVYCPVGWSPVFEIEPREQMEKVFNIVHLGDLLSKRHHNKNYYHKSYRDIITVKHGFGETRDIIILQSKIYLILKRSVDYEFPQIRAMFAMCNKVFTLVSVHSDYGVYQPDKHFVVFNDEDLREDSKHWLSHDKQREEFAVECYRDIKENHTFTMHLEQVFKGTILQGI